MRTNYLCPKPIVLIILDGWGISPIKAANAVLLASTSNMDKLWTNYSHTFLEASAEAVGLPARQIGGSEIGHLNLGAGRIMQTDISYIDSLIENEQFFENPILLETIEHTKRARGKLHIIGLVSDGGIHSHIDHLLALIKLAQAHDFKEVYTHAILDGRDVPPKSAIQYIRKLEDYMNKIGVGKIATVSGRYFTMDRDKRWERVEKAYKVMVSGKGRIATSSIQAVENAYAHNESDEFVTPTVIVSSEDSPLSTINDGDTVLAFNFRGDRMRQIVHTLTDDTFDNFQRAKAPNVNFVSFMQYSDQLAFPAAFNRPSDSGCLGYELERAGLTQLRIAESEKFPHVTFFFNGKSDIIFDGEERVHIPSPKDVAYYSEKPEMSAPEVTEKLISLLHKKLHDFVLLNFANPDMVGHTGALDPAIQAVEVVDKNLGKVLNTVHEIGGTAIITADHGNCEQMREYHNGAPHTAHTTNLVPFIFFNEKLRPWLRPGVLADIAPTILQLFGIDKPEYMDRVSLFRKV